MLGTEGGDSMAGQDKGFQPFYYNLSPRRKFIRTVWMTLLGVLVIAGWWWLTGLQMDLILFIAVFTVVDKGTAPEEIEESRRIADIAHEGQDPLSGPIKLGVIYTIGPYLLPELIRELSIDQPNMPVYLEENFTSELLERLKTGQLDLAIMADTIADTGFMTLELYSEEFVVAVPSHHPWVNRNYVGPDELKDQTMLLLGAGHCFRDQIIGVCPDLMRFQAQASDVQRTVEGSSLQTICHMVAQGLGITVLPASAIPYLSGFSKSLKIIPFKAPVPTRRVLLVWRKSYPRMQAVEAVQAAVKKLRMNGCLPLDEKPRMR